MTLKKNGPAAGARTLRELMTLEKDGPAAGARNLEDKAI